MTETYQHYREKYGIGVHQVNTYDNIEVVTNYVKFWSNGKRHRLDGPAMIWSDELPIWYINDTCVDIIIKVWANDNNIDLDNLSEDDKILIKLVWSDYNCMN